MKKKELILIITILFLGFSIQSQAKGKSTFSTKFRPNGTISKTWVSVSPAKDPKYVGQKVIGVKTNPKTPQSDHKTWISDGKGNLYSPR